jgi:hypothetical protein
MDLTMMERVGDREEKMEGSCSTGQSPLWAVVPVEEEEKEEEEEEEEEILPLKPILNHMNTIHIRTFDVNERPYRDGSTYTLYLESPAFKTSSLVTGKN